MRKYDSKKTDFEPKSDQVIQYASVYTGASCIVKGLGRNIRETFPPRKHFSLGDKSLESSLAKQFLRHLPHQFWHSDR